MRQCGECNLCCKLLPMQRTSRDEIAATASKMIEAGLATAASFQGMLAEFDKPAGQRCPHQSHHRGCKVYRHRPFGCRYWNCRWLVNDDTADLRRPDRVGYVIDLMCDFITIQDAESEPVNIQVVQIWVDPKDRDAWRDEALLAYLDRRGQEGTATLIRFNSSDGMIVFPPSMSGDGQWHERRDGISRGEHRGEELFAGLATSRKVVVSA